MILTKDAQGKPDTNRWVMGEYFGLQIPADMEALLSRGTDFLTEAFLRFEMMSPGNRVIDVVDAQEFAGGGTGKKFLLSMVYERAEPNLPEQLFVKFSRNFEDELSDRARFVSISEVNFAVLSRAPGFPVSVPATMFADIDSTSGTGLIVSECISYGRNGVEPHHLKCMDYNVPDQVGHYRAIMTGLATLAGASRSGRLPAALAERFPYDHAAALAARKIDLPEAKVVQRAGRLFDFIERYPRLFPSNVRTVTFRDEFLRDIPDVIAARAQLRALTHRNRDFVAFSHWNANIDNCWFTRGPEGNLQCGFLDWANAGPMSVAQSILGSISGAEPHIWDNHLDDLVTVFIDEFAVQGGPVLALDEVRRDILLMVATNFDWSMGAPIAVGRAFADPGVLESSQDPQLLDHENARIQLHMTTRMLNVWQTRQLGDLVRASVAVH
jgi:hypothetical protein